MDEIREEITEILQELLPDAELEGQTALIDGGVLNSFQIVELIGQLSDAFDIKIRSKYLVPENFNSIDAMARMVQTILDD